VEIASNPPLIRDYLGHQLSASPARPRVALIGFPSDEGVRRNRGRTGAALAPALILEAFLALPFSSHGEPDLVRLLQNTQNRGPLQLSRDLEHDQRTLAAEIRGYLEAGTVCVVIGGGHETAYGHFLGYVGSNRRVRILNWDAHADVRPLRDGKGHSGSPFRQAITHDSRLCLSYTVAGLQPHTDPDHVNFISSHGGRCFPSRGLNTSGVETVYRSFLDPPGTPQPPAAPPSALMVTFDMDAVDSSSAPGVSAPSKNGLGTEVWLHAAFLAGQFPLTQSLELVEVNPRFDPDGRTIRLAAQTLLAFFRGLAARSPETRPNLG
jgi:formiminoglutamase